MLLGSISSQYEGAKTAFALGAMTASFVFFFTLGYGARLLRPLFANPRAWRVLDACVGVAMLAIGVKLVV
ncbi:arginine exporter protein [compost metagenome]